MDHHFIPQFWLKRWADSDGMVLRYKRRDYDGTVVSRRLSPKSFAFGKDLYKTPVPDDQMSQWLEREFFGPIDDLAAAALEQLLAGTNPLPGKALRDWMHFTLTLFFRSPTAFTELHAAAKRRFLMTIEDTRPGVTAAYETHRALVEETIAECLTEEWQTQSLHAFLPKLIFDKDVVDLLATFEWSVLPTPGDCPTLLLSDDPVLRPVGLKKPGALLAMPLSPAHILVAVQDPRFGEMVRAIPRKGLVKDMNQWTVQGAREFVAASDERQAGFIGKHLGSVPRATMASAIR